MNWGNNRSRIICHKACILRRWHRIVFMMLFVWCDSITLRISKFSLYAVSGTFLRLRYVRIVFGILPFLQLLLLSLLPKRTKYNRSICEMKSRKIFPFYTISLFAFISDIPFGVTMLSDTYPLLSTCLLTSLLME